MTATAVASYPFIPDHMFSTSGVLKVLVLWSP